MKIEDFIYKNVAKLLSEKYPSAKKTLIASASGVAKRTFLSGGNFKGKAFDVCYKEAEINLKQSIKAKL